MTLSNGKICPCNHKIPILAHPDLSCHRDFHRRLITCLSFTKCAEILAPCPAGYLVSRLLFHLLLPLPVSMPANSVRTRPWGLEAHMSDIFDITFC